MIDIQLLADPARCPECAGPLPAPRPSMCERCALPLTGPLALELWTVSGDAKRLLERRQTLLRQLRATAVPAAGPPSVPVPTDAGGSARSIGPPPQGPLSTSTHPPVPPVPPPYSPGGWRREVFGALPVTQASPGPSRPGQAGPASAYAAAGPGGPGVPPGAGPEVGRRRVARLILGTGVLFLIVAAIVFVAMTWERSGTGGRAIVMALMLVAAATGTALAERRDLPLTAEALGVVSVALGLLDGYAAYAADLGGVRGSGGLLVSAVTVGAVGAAALAGSMVLGLRTLRVSAALLLQAPVPLLAGHFGDASDSLLPLAVGFAAQAAAEVALLRWAFRTPIDATVKVDGHAPAAGRLPQSPAVRIALLATGAYWLAAFVLACTEAGSGAAAVTMTLVAIAAGFIAWAMRGFAAVRHLASGACAAAIYTSVALAVALADDGSSDSDVSAPWAIATLAALTLLMVVLVYVAPRAFRPGPLVVCVLPFLVGGVTAVVAVATAVFGPVAWVLQAWSADDGLSGARALMSPDADWSWGAAPAVIVATVAATVAIALHQLGRGTWWRVLALAAAVPELLLLPYVFDFPLPVALAYQMVAGAALVAGAGRSASDVMATVARVSGFALMALTAVWSLAYDDVSVATWSALALILVGLAFTVPNALRPALAATTTAVVFTAATMAAHWREVDGPVIAAGLAVAGSVTVAVGAHGARRAPLVVWPVVWVACAWAFGGLVAASPDERAFAVALGAVAVAALAGAVSDGPVRRPWWAAACVAAAVAATAVGAYAAGMPSAWSAVVGAVAAGLVLAAGPSAVGRRVSLEKGGAARRVVLASTIEAVAACALASSALNSVDDEWARTVVLAVATLAAACRVPAGRSAVQALWSPVLAVLLIGTAVAASVAAETPDSAVALVALGVASALFVLLPHLPASLVPLPVAVAAVLVCGAGAGVMAVAGTDPGLTWLGLFIAGTAAVLAGCVPSRVAGMENLRQAAAASGALLLLGAYWTALGTVNVSQPEPYTAPPGLALLAGGWWLRRRKPALHSWSAYGLGLAVVLLPSLPLAISDDDALRPALLGAAALASLVVGARFRLQAPLLMGVGTLAVLAVFQLSAPALAAYHALPRWGVFAGAGALLIVLGWSYERRMRDLARLGRSVRALD